jgi:hypothetical protein
MINHTMAELSDSNCYFFSAARSISLDRRVKI